MIKAEKYTLTTNIKTFVTHNTVHNLLYECLMNIYSNLCHPTMSNAQIMYSIYKLSPYVKMCSTNHKIDQK